MMCALNRWRIGDALERGAPLAPRARAHVDGCAACGRYATGLAELDRGLRAGAAAAPTPRVVRATTRGRTPLAIGLAAAATAAIVLSIVAGRTDVATAPSASPRAVVIATPAAAPTAARPRRAAIVLDRAADLAIDPLRAEALALLDDGRRGARAVLKLGALGR